MMERNDEFQLKISKSSYFPTQVPRARLNFLLYLLEYYISGHDKQDLVASEMFT
jgi:hypothetical protein